MHLVYPPPPKLWITIVFKFTWVLTVVPGEIEDNGNEKFGEGWEGGKKVHYGLCEQGEYLAQHEPCKFFTNA